MRRPVFLVNGNHEQAARYLLDGTPNNVAVWVRTARNAHYSQPVPDGFYTGNAETVPHIGLLRNYFAWAWGDALFAHHVLGTGRGGIDVADGYEWGGRNGNSSWGSRRTGRAGPRRSIS